MNYKEATIQLHMLVSCFYEYYVSKIKADSVSHLVSLSEDEWWEQFLTFAELRKPEENP